jgi:Bax protein
MFPMGLRGLGDRIRNRRIVVLALLVGGGIAGALLIFRALEPPPAPPTWSLHAIRAGEAEVPRSFVTSLPRPTMKSAPTAERKKQFFRILLPLVLSANETIGHERARLQRILHQRGAGGRVSRRDGTWLARLAEHYGVAPTDAAALRRRVDVIPPSMALAQAAIESAWGTSRFALEGNALFGLWTWREETGLIPQRRSKSASYAVRKYDALSQSVRSYIHTLNTHQAYRGLRKTRAAMRAANGRLDTSVLVDHLHAYAVNDRYVKIVKKLIRNERLQDFDSARLASD